MAQRKAKKILALMNAPVLPTPPPAALAPPERNFLLESGLHNFQQLTAMGFSGEKSLAALQHARNNLQSAVDILTDETPSSDPELPPAPPAPVTPPTPSAPLYHQYPSPITQPPKITPRPPTHQNALPSPERNWKIVSRE
ncbi:hypothetical protein Pelo_4160 [Pelomyxa schiedti]|nr:hypothetical protein Pelo_4160 [Pelomyxa schiedti]